MDQQRHFSSRDLRARLIGRVVLISTRRRLAAAIPLLAALGLWFIIPSSAHTSAFRVCAPATGTARHLVTCRIEAVTAAVRHPAPRHRTATARVTAPAVPTALAATVSAVTPDSSMSNGLITASVPSISGVPVTGVGEGLLRSGLVGLSLMTSGLIVLDGIRRAPRPLPAR